MAGRGTTWGSWLVYDGAVIQADTSDSQDQAFLAPSAWLLVGVAHSCRKFAQIILAFKDDTVHFQIREIREIRAELDELVRVDESHLAVLTCLHCRNDERRVSRWEPGSRALVRVGLLDSLDGWAGTRR